MEKRNADPEPFVCSNCGSNSVVNPSRIRSSNKTTKSHPRYAVIDGTRRTLCNRCGLHWSRKRKFPAVKKPGRCSSKRYKKRSKSSDNRIIESFVSRTRSERIHVDDELVNDFICGCDCSLKYVFPKIEQEETKFDNVEEKCGVINNYAIDREKLTELIEIRTKALTLRDIKVQKRRRSPVYVDFVFETLEKLRSTLCYDMLKKWLKFSNSLLYKRPVIETDDGVKITGRSRRDERRGKKNYSYTLEQLSKGGCCLKNCGTKVNIKQMEMWRTAYAQGSQVDRWQVIQSMKLGSDRKFGGKCVKFICGVTGCSRNLCAAVERTMSATGMAGPPPKHGLIKKSSSSMQGDQKMNDSLQPGNPLLAISKPILSSNNNLLQSSGGRGSATHFDTDKKGNYS